MDLIGEERLEGFVLRTLSVVEGKVHCSPSAHSHVHLPPHAQSGNGTTKLVHFSHSPPLQASIDVLHGCSASLDMAD